MKRKDEPAEDLMAIAETGAVMVVEAEPEQAEPTEPAPYRENTWNGMRHWECAFCAWDTLEGEAEMMHHYISRHAAPEPAPAPTVIVYDRWGRPVQ
jgi:hypothetical protein